jgi:short-subunit dehydrogenase
VPFRNPRRILITGASGGIGRALARHYAAPGRMLVLHGRRVAVLDEVATACRERGAEVSIGVLDLRDVDAVRAWVTAIFAEAPIDLLIANAGVTSVITPSRRAEAWEAVEDVLRVNVLGTVGLVEAALVPMRARGAGQIALVGSLAAWHGVPFMPSYSASKAALKAYGEALRGAIASDGIGVSVIMPGFVDSAMSRLVPAATPFLLTPEDAARIIERGLARNRARISFPRPLALANWTLGVLPADVARWCLVRFGYGVPR